MSREFMTSEEYAVPHSTPGPIVSIVRSSIQTANFSCDVVSVVFWRLGIMYCAGRLSVSKPKLIIFPVTAFILVRAEDANGTKHSKNLFLDGFRRHSIIIKAKFTSPFERVF